MKNLTLLSGTLQNWITWNLFLRAAIFFPQDRVIINRLDNICHVVLKGKWPSSQQYEPSGALPTPILNSSAGSRNSLSEPEAAEHGFNNGAALAAQIQKVRLQLMADYQRTVATPTSH